MKILQSVENISLDGTWVLINENKNLQVQCPVPGTVFEALINNGAKEVYASGSHAIFSGPAITRIQNSVLKKVIVTNTIPLSDEAKKSDKIVQLSVAELLGEAIKRIHEESSVSSLFI